MTLDLHVGVYNHFEGGIDRDAGFVRRLDRLNGQLDVLVPLSLDVLISTEAKGWFGKDDGVALDLAQARLGLTPFWVLAPRHDCNLVIWVNMRRFGDVREHHETHHPFWHAQARVSVAMDGLGERLWLFGAHFLPFVPSIRVDEAYATCDLADGRLVIGGGDFNDDALSDPVPSRRRMPPYKQLRHARPGAQSAAAVLDAAGFVDAAECLTPGGPHEPTAGFKHESPLRCDRQYAGARLAGAVRDYERLPFDPALSDHCGIRAWYDLAVAC